MKARIRRIRAASAAFFIACSTLLAGAPAFAQAWQVPDHSVPVGRGSGSTGFKSVGPCASGVPIVGTGASSDPVCAPASTNPRELLPADRSYFVRTNGNNTACTGLINAAYVSGSYPQPCAFATPQKAADIIYGSLDLQYHTVTVTVAAGTYSGSGVVVDGSPVGGCSISFVGDAGTPTNVLIDATGGGYGFKLSNGACLTINGFKVQSSLGNVVVTTDARAIMQNIVFGAGQDFEIESGAYLEYSGNMTLANGGAKGIHIHLPRGGRAYFHDGIATLTGTNGFANFFAGGSENSALDYQSFSFSGAGTGPRYFFHVGMTVRLNAAYSTTFFPGDVAGTCNGSATVENIFCGGVNFGDQTLVNYKEAAWTPADNSGAGLVFTGVSANYTRIGRMVYAYAQFNYPVTADGSNAGISGLPIAAANQDYATSGCTITFTNAAANKQALIAKNTQNVNFYVPNSVTRATNAQLSATQMNLSCAYPVN